MIMNIDEKTFLVSFLFMLVFVTCFYLLYDHFKIKNSRYKYDANGNYSCNHGVGGALGNRATDTVMRKQGWRERETERERDR